jgi:hypothetical protein
MPLNPLPSRALGRSDLTPETNEAAVGMAWVPGVERIRAVMTGTAIAAFVWGKRIFGKMELDVGSKVNVCLMCCYRGV